MPFSFVMIAVVAGATGLVGSRVLSPLLQDSAFESVIALARRPLAQTHPKLKTVLIHDLQELPAMKEELRGDVYFCCLGTTIKTAGSQEAFRRVDLDAVVEFGRIAKAHGARSFVLVSAAGSDPKSSLFYSRVKGEAEQALGLLGLHRLVIARPGLLIGDRKESRPAERAAIVATRLVSAVTPRFILDRFATPVDDLAEILVREAKITESGVKLLPPSALSRS
jgi:uncharacterized protein YbjT (DUF2867 family)